MCSDYEILVREAADMHHKLGAALDVCRRLVAWCDGHHERMPILQCVEKARAVLEMPGEGSMTNAEFVEPVAENQGRLFP